MEDYFDELYRNYDRDFNKALDNKEFKNLQLLQEKKTELFFEIDKNNDNIIKHKEVVEYFRTLSSGKEFKYIFLKYSNLNELIITKKLFLFFQNEEKETIDFYDPINIIIKLSTKINNEEKNNLFHKIDILYISNNNTITEYQIKQIINDFILENEKVNKIKKNFSLTMNLQEFSFILYSEFMTVYNLDKIDLDLNDELPLTDYYINSTHNTYFTSH